MKDGNKAIRSRTLPEEREVSEEHVTNETWRDFGTKNADEHD